MHDIIPRDQFLAWIDRWRDKDVIKVVSGIRRCGKTTLLESYRQTLRKSGIPAKRIVSVNFELPDTPEFVSYRDAWKFIRSKLSPGGRNYVFLDEVQLVPGFERLVDGLFAQKDCDIYITGSNSKFLSGELATFLTGRYVEIRLHPFSFAEYRGAHPSGDVSVERLFADYMRFGGFPFATLLPKVAALQSDYLSGVLNTILYKDILARNGIRDEDVLRRLVRFIFCNVGSMTSVNRIANTFRSDGFAMNNKTLDSYLSLLCDSFLVCRAGRYDVRGRELLKTNAKYYVADSGFRRLLLPDRQEDIGHTLENIVFLELQRRYREVHVGVVGNKEVDFVALEDTIPHYFQVALTVRDKTTLERELAPLEAIPDNHPKTLLTLDPDPPRNYDGIQQVSVIDFLLSPQTAGLP